MNDRNHDSEKAAIRHEADAIRDGFNEDPDHALDRAGQWVRDNPHSALAQRTLGSVLFDLQRFEPALRCFEQAVRLCADDDNRLALAEALLEAGYPDRAQPQLDCLTDADTPLARACRIRSLAARAKIHDAEALLYATLASPDAPVSLIPIVARFGLGLNDPDLVSRLTGLLATTDQLSRAERAAMTARLADILHLQHHHAAAFRMYGAANELTRFGRRDTRAQLEGFLAEVTRAISTFPGGHLDTEPDVRLDHDQPRLLTIMGARRSGKTLLESQLGHHPAIATGMELTAFENVLRQIEAGTGHDRNKLLQALPLEQRLKCAAPYQRTLDERGRGHDWVTDTNPVNLTALGFMWASIPGSRFIFVRRSTEDVGFSIFAADMPGYFPGCLELDELDLYLQACERLIDFWLEVFGDRAMTVDYEDLIGERRDHVLADCCRFLGISLSAALTPDPSSPSESPLPSQDACGCQQPDPRFRGVGEPYREWLGPLQPYRGDRPDPDRGAGPGRH